MSEEIAEQLGSRVGTTLASKYTLRRLLGAGGMGAVYEAVNTWTERVVALKLMSASATANQELAARFLREARAASRIRHPNIVDVLDMGQDADGTLYIVQEFLEGHDLRHLLDERGSLSPQETLELIVPVISALAAAHARGVVHRDIKPENIFISRTELGTVPKLIDFGIARLTEPGSDAALTRTGAAVGTPLYMSPEQAQGDRDIDAKTDVWSIGVVLFECLTGRCPFEGTNYNAVIARILTATTPRVDAMTPSVPQPLADVISKALERDNTQRFASMSELLTAVLECPTYATEPWHQTLRTSHRALLAAAAAQQTTPDEDLTATPKVPQRPLVKSSFSEGKSWMSPELAATTLGRTAREIVVPTPTRSRRGPVVAGVLGLAAVLAAVIGVSVGRRSSTNALPVSRPQPSAPASLPVASPPTTSPPFAAPTAQVVAPAISPSVSPSPSGPPAVASAPRLPRPATTRSAPRVRTTDGSQAPPPARGHNGALVIPQ